jgi:hypothetical protein
MNNELASVASTLEDIAFRVHERACADCKAGVHGLCRNSEACVRTMRDARYLRGVAECLKLS